MAFGKVDGQLTAMLDIATLSTNLPISAPRSLLCGGSLSTRWEGQWRQFQQAQVCSVDQPLALAGW